MVSEKKMNANKTNSLKGWVKTDEGKIISSQNSYKHWLTTKQFASIDERELYKKVFQNIVTQYQPFDIIEWMLCERIALQYTKLLRVVNIETAETEKYTLNAELKYLKSIKPKTVAEKEFVITPTQAERQYSTLSDKEKANEISRDQSKINTKLHSIERSSLGLELLEKLEKIQGYETIIENRMYKAIKELLHIQSTRKAVMEK